MNVSMTFKNKLCGFQVLAASDIDCEEERVPGEGLVGKSGPGSSRRVAQMGSVSGADDAVYYEYKKSSSTAHKHPLFKKFRC